MSHTVKQARLTALLTAVDRPSPAKAQLLTAREKGPQIIRAAIARSGLLLKQITDKDHGQASREIDAKEKLDFHEMVEAWPVEVWKELLPLLAVSVCGDAFEVERAVTIKEKQR